MSALPKPQKLDEATTRSWRRYKGRTNHDSPTRVSNKHSYIVIAGPLNVSICLTEQDAKCVADEVCRLLNEYPYVHTSRYGRTFRARIMVGFYTYSTNKH